MLQWQNAGDKSSGNNDVRALYQRREGANMKFKNAADVTMQRVFKCLTLAGPTLSLWMDSAILRSLDAQSQQTFRLRKIVGEPLGLGADCSLRFTKRRRSESLVMTP
jgi:hypothetical protein